VVTYGKDLPPVLTERFLAEVLAARGIEAANPKNGTSTPYVQIWIPGKKSQRLVLKTKDKKKTLNPVWNQEFEFRMQDFDRIKDVLEFHLYSRDRVGENQPLGIVELALKDIVNVSFIDSWFAIYDSKHRSKRGQGELHLRIAFGKVEQEKLEEALEEDEEKPPKIGPPATIFRISRDTLERKKVKDRDKRFHATKGLPIRVRVVAASALKSSHSDPYVVVEIPGKKTSVKLKTRVEKNTGNPVWNEEFQLANESLENDDRIRFCVHSDDMIGSSLMGLADVEVADIVDSDDGIFSKALPLLNSKAEEDKARGNLHVLIGYGDAKLPEIMAQSGGVRVRSGTVSARGKYGSSEIAKNAISSDDIELDLAKESGSKSARKSSEPGPLRIRRGTLSSLRRRRKKSVQEEEENEKDEESDEDEKPSKGSRRKKSSGDIEKGGKRKKSVSKESLEKKKKKKKKKDDDSDENSEDAASDEEEKKTPRKKKKKATTKKKKASEDEASQKSEEPTTPRSEEEEGKKTKKKTTKKKKESEDEASQKSGEPTTPRSEEEEDGKSPRKKTTTKKKRKTSAAEVSEKSEDSAPDNVKTPRSDEAEKKSAGSSGDEVEIVTASGRKTKTKRVK